MAMVGDLTHRAVDYEILTGVPDPRHERQHLDHQDSLVVGAKRSMLPQNRHRRVAGITIDDRKAKGVRELAVSLGVFLQLAKLAIGHGST